MISEQNNSINQSIHTLLLLLLAIAILFFAYTLFGFLPDKRVTINNQNIDVTVVDSSKEREKGLSGRDRLSEREGMLFSFTNEDEYCFWMKDVNFPIDIIWFNSQKQVVDIKRSATPDSYPETFCPNQAAQYVLEVNAGKSDEWNISINDEISF